MLGFMISVALKILQNYGKHDYLFLISLNIPFHQQAEWESTNQLLFIQKK